MKTAEDLKITLKDVFGLKRDQADFTVIEERVTEGAKVTGTNMYILILAILIASIGLNMNSTAVVIGAMLISPLMGPIISVAYGVAKQDFAWLKRSAGKFLFQIGISVISSTVYFWLSPIESFSGELAARTNPTIWDVMIALFGGFAAIIANTRKNTMITVVPGAAIATALMPPLCTTGYCLATAKWVMASRAFYLFAINSVFICLASILVLKFEGVANEKKKETTGRKRLFIGVMVLLIVLPSAILAWQSVNDTILQENYKNFITKEFNIERTQVVKSNISKEKKVIKVALVGANVDSDTVKEIEDSMKDYDLDQYRLEVTQPEYDDYISHQDVEALIESSQLGLGKAELAEKLREAEKLLELNSVKELFKKEAIDELMVLYPEIKSAGITEMTDNSGETEPVIVIEATKDIGNDTKKNIEKWLKEKFGKTIRIVQTK